MTNGFRQNVGLLVLLAAMTGCAAQNLQNTDPKVAEAPVAERGYRQCLGSVCGPKSQTATWLFEFAPTRQEDRAANLENHCFGAVCGPQATTAPTWTLEPSTQDCLASVCGREAMTATTTTLGRQLAQARNASCTQLP